MTSPVDPDTFSGRSPRLSYDILLLCFTFIASRRDVSSLMRTCKTLFGPGIPYILADTVNLPSVEKTVQFLQFVFSRSFRAERFHNLRSLSISSWYDMRKEEYQILAPPITQLLRRTTNLEDLDLQLLDDFCDADPNFLNAISSLPSLRKLRIGDAESKVMDLLSSIRSPLQELDVSFSIDLDLPDPLPHLGNLGSTLTTMTLHLVDLHDRSVRCSSVRYLMIETHFEVDTTALVLSFPGLISLHILTCNEGALDDEADQLRAWNQGNLGSREQWTTLRELSAEAVDLYVMGLTCPIRSLEISSINATKLGVVQSLLDFHHPQYIGMSLSPSTFLAPGTTVRETFEELCLSCTHLSLNLYPTRAPIDALIAAMVDSLSGLPLTHLKISFSLLRSRGWMRRAGRRSNQGGETIATTPNTTEDEHGPAFKSYFTAHAQDPEDIDPTQDDIKTLVGDIAVRMPNLVHIGFDIPCTSSFSKFWDVYRIPADSGDDQQIFLKEINQYEAREGVWRAAQAGSEN